MLIEYNKKERERMYYILRTPIIHKEDERVPILRKLFKEVLGYTEEEVDEFIRTEFLRAVVVDLTLEEAERIVQIFWSHGLQVLSLNKDVGEGGGFGEMVGWHHMGIYKKYIPQQEHYEPVISREHLVNAFEPRPVAAPINTILGNTEPIVECPYCHSTNTKKISGMSKAGSIALLGIFGLGKTIKQWHCNKCKSDF